MSVHILRTQSWAGGFTEPPATTRICVFTTIEIYTKFQLQQKRTGDYRFPHKHRYLRGVFDEKRLR